MFSNISKYSNFDWVSISATLFLLASGLVAIYSLSIGQEGEGLNNFEKQVIFLFIGLVLFIFFSFLDYRIWKTYAGILYLFGNILLVAVLLWGNTIRGTSGWFTFGSFNFQPVEIMKIFMIIFLAKFFAKKTSMGIGWKEFLASFVYLIIPVFFVMLQPDLGSATVMVIIWLGMLFLSGVDKKVFSTIIISGIIVSLIGWGFFLKDYQKDRIEILLNPQADPLGSGYNIIQSMVAVGSGGLMGKGLGHGSQSQLNFLPERHTDFIYAAIAEESGFIGVFLLLAILGLLFYRFKKTADQSRDDFGQLLVGGILIMFFFHTLVNIGMNLGIMPVAGLSLPFISYGGSFLIISMLAFGIIQSVWRLRHKKRISLVDELY
ncbi:MAG: rod shape-determining protein RodA [Patescibacteria group bacterium]|jgi:rod shape determining protein RodA|nr:rod shape-determining protein RodA [Patescibacteria group bacterium]